MRATNKSWPFVAYMEQRGVRKLSFCNDGEDSRTWRPQAQKHFFSHTDARSYVEMLAPVSEDSSKMAPLKRSVDVIHKQVPLFESQNNVVVVVVQLRSVQLLPQQSSSYWIMGIYM
jgi:hypothetical protein